MGKKEKFIDKNNSQKFHVLHRSQRDEAHANFEVPSNFVLVPAVDVRALSLSVVFVNSYRLQCIYFICRMETTTATIMAVAAAIRRQNLSSLLPIRITSTNSASQTMVTTTHSISETLVSCALANIALGSSLTIISCFLSLAQEVEVISSPRLAEPELIWTCLS